MGTTKMTERQSIKAAEMLELMNDYGLKDFMGVPCSYLNSLVVEIEKNNHCQYINATNEGEALSISAGMSLSGNYGVVLCQNSGLGNMVNPITSLSHSFSLASLILMTWRGMPGQKDEPQHELMGKITLKMLELLEVKYAILESNLELVREQIEEAISYMKTYCKPYVLIVKKGVFDSCENVETESKKLSRYEVLKTIVDNTSDTNPVIATTGKTGRELYTIKDRNNQLYCVGSMGYASSLALGVCMSSRKKTYIIDGDGAMLMHMGNVATIGASSIENFIHIVLDNGAYDSTGGQTSVSSKVSFANIARACGYRASYHVNNLKELENYLKDDIKGPVLLHINIDKGSINPLGRPNISPSDVAIRFQKNLNK